MAIPSRIPPQGTTFCTQTGDGRMVVELNWYLFLYNLAMQVFGVDGVPVPPSVLIAMSDDEANAADVGPALRLALNAEMQLDDPVLQDRTSLNVAQQMPELEIGPSLRAVVNALILAQDNLLQDPIPAARPAVGITLTGSPFTYPVWSDGSVAISGAGATLVSVIRQGVTVPTGVTVGLIPVRRSDQVQITYGVAPTVNFLPA
jgi:hypothetical protein